VKTKKFSLKSSLIFLLPLALAGLLFWQNPYGAVWQRISLPEQSLNTAQKTNIDVALRQLNGQILKPYEKWSFNKVIGPRTERRGYQVAPSYLEGETQGTLGGGICLVSSAVYQLALKSGLTILDRTPHLKTIQTVPAGLDATVWYGQADLVIKNPYPFPLALQAHPSPQGHELALNGPSPTHNKSLRIIQKANGPDHLWVTVLRSPEKSPERSQKHTDSPLNQGEPVQWERVSLDQYQTNH
jgi:vancomycin resistance protein YoaR